MRKLFAMAICFVLLSLPCISVAEGESAVQQKADPEESVLVKEAIEIIKQEWLKEYQSEHSMSKTGHLQIVHTKVVYIREDFALQEFSESAAGKDFQDAYCLIEFTLLTDYYGSGPYYEDVRLNDSVVVYRNGSMALKNKSIFSIYRSRTFICDLSDIIDSIHDCGSEYNASFDLLENP